MRHLSYGRKLGRSTKHRWALFRNMASALVLSERIETTLNKAKELRPFADHLITVARQDSLAARRQAFDFLRSRTLVGKLFTELAPRFKDRQGGYTRIYRLGYRLGDSSPMAMIEYLPDENKTASLQLPEKKSANRAPKTEKKKAAKEKKDSAETKKEAVKKSKDKK